MTVQANRVISIFVCSLICLGFSLGAYAESADQTEKELKQLAQDQFSVMYRRGVDAISPRLEAGEHIKPFAVVTDKKNHSKVVRIKQIEKMPDGMALQVLRRSLHALALKGKIGASAIFYQTDNPNENAETEKVLVSEMEHIFGMTLAQLTPFSIKASGAKFGSSVVVDMEPTIFKSEEGKEEDK